jgi:hypothetical protein
MTTSVVLTCQQQECPVEQHEEASAGAVLAPTYSAGAASNFVSQPREQK